MATHNPKKPHEASPKDEPAAAKPEAARVEHAKAHGKRRGGSWRRLLALSLLLASGAIAAGPWLISRGGVSNRLLALAPAPFNRIRVGGASLSWWSPVSLSDVELLDAEGASLLTAEAVASEKTLLAMISGCDDLGRITVARPVLSLAMREKGSNLEDFLASLPQGGGGSGGPSLEVVVSNGAISLDDSVGKRKFDFGQLSVSCKYAGATGELALDCSTSLGDAPKQPTAEPAAATIKFALSISPAIAASPAEATGSSAGATGSSAGATGSSADASSSSSAAAPTTASEASVASVVPPAVAPQEASTLVSSIPWPHGKPPAAAAPAPPMRGTFSCQASGFPLAASESLLRRWMADAELSGELTGVVSGEWGPTGASSVAGQTLTCDAKVSGLSFGAAALGADRVRLAQLHLPCQLSLAGKSLNVEQVAIECDLGQISASGQAPMDARAWPSVWAALARDRFQIDGKLDLARLAAMLPGALKVKQGVEITAGSATLAVSSQSAAEGGHWQARLEGANLAALDAGRTVTCEQPLVIQVSGHADASGPIVDQAECDASFLHFKASGALDNLTGQGTFDLAKLTAEAAQFIDLGTFKLAGSGSTSGSWRQADDQSFTAQIKLDAKDFQVALPNRPAWRESALTAELDARGMMAAGTTAGIIKQIDKATLTVSGAEVGGAQERLTIGLAESIGDLTHGPWPLHIDWQGPMNGWTGRLALWLDVAAWELAGQGTLGGTVVVAGDQIEFQDCRLNADRLHAWLPGIFFDEPSFEITAAGTWNRAKQSLSLPDVVAVCGQAGVRIANLNWAVDANGAATTTGDLAYKLELEQLVRWIRDPRQPPAWSVAGTASGGGRLNLAPGVSGAEVSGAVDNLQVISAPPPQQLAPPGQASLVPIAALSPSAPAWREQQLKMAFKASYDHARDLLDIAEAEIAGATLRCAVTGTVAALNGEQNLDLKGELDYDWTALMPLLTPYIGSRVVIAGQERRPFSLQGPWSPPGGAGINYAGLAGGAGLGWAQASVYGLPIGPGQLVGVLSRGLVQFQPLDLTVSGGQVHINEQWRIAPAPGKLQMAKGRLVDRVQVTPEVCAQALRYVAPILSDVTRAEGVFSIDIEGGRLTFGDARGCDILGKFVTEQAHVQAGPIAQQFALLAQRLESLLLARPLNADQAAAVIVDLSNENVDFRVVDGRAYHRNLAFQIGALQITTQGSVGFDDSLEMFAEVGLADSLLDGRPLLAALKDHPLQIPLTGSLSSPRLDLRAVEQLTASLARQTIDAAVEKPLDLLQKPLGALERPLDSLERPLQGLTPP